MRQFLSKYFKGDSIIWILILLLAIISAISVYSSSGTLAYRYKDGNTTYYILRHVVFLLIGFGVIIMVHNIHYKYFSRLSLLLLPLSVVLLVLTIFSGNSLNEASRWITVPVIGLSFQPSEMAKIALIMYIARILSVKQKDDEPTRDAFRPIMIAIGIVCGLIFTEDFSTAVLIAGIGMAMMLIGRVPVTYLLYTVGAGVVVVALIVLLAMQFPDVKAFHRVDTWISRVETFGENDNADMDKAFQANQAKIAISTGGLFGKGPGNSIQRDFLPHPYSDFIYAMIVEEGGLFFGIIVLLFYLIMLYRAGVIVRKCRTTFPAFLVIGLMLAFTLQALAHMAVSVNLMPVTGQTLPMVSMGGTSILFTSIALGMVLSVSRYAVVEDAEEVEQGKKDVSEIEDNE
ncbi:FtsW/RodA/SpoVE family cell cycle protein [Saccharicrinis sp. FJH54]|uniref:FtsW/RodA/SpoVE family cell cycle protein n=1 Tax=Saccharicrinis sp. FJH54 TaxID=3344665 RepID=UPI0035D3F017